MQLIALTPQPQLPPPPLPLLSHTLYHIFLILTLLIPTLLLPLPLPPNFTWEEIYGCRKRSSSISDITLPTAIGSILLPLGSRGILILFLTTTTNAP